MDQRLQSGRLILRGLTKRFAGVVAVDDVDLEVDRGEFVTLLGPSGSGKTTTLMMVAGFARPTAGEIFIDERPITGLAPEKRNIGVVFQNYALFPHMTVFENIAFPLKMRRVAQAARRGKVLSALDMVRLTDLGQRLPRQLSGGQQQRVALARALVFDPGLLLMDEPLGALDKNLREQMQIEVKRLHEALRITVLYVTHDQEEALTLSDRVALMNRGRIEQVGAAEELYERPANRFVAEFIGESNLLEGQVEGGEAPGRAWFVSADGLRVPVGVEPGAAAAGRRLLVLRPEKVSLGPVEGSEPVGYLGKVEEVIYVGEVTRYRVRTRGGDVLTAKVPNRGGVFRARPGEAVRVWWHPDDGRLLPASA